MGKKGFAMKMALLGVLLAAALAGCQATRYQPAADSGGFAEMELIDDLWRVRFMANAHTTRETAQSYWLYRAAELTISKGYDGFEVLPQIGQVRSHGQARSSALVIEGEIRMLKAPFEFVPPRTFNAASLKASLDPHVNGAKCDTQTTSGNICPHAHDYLLAKSQPKPVASKAETPLPPSNADGLRLKMGYSIPCVGSGSPGQPDCQREPTDRRVTEPAGARAAKPKPAPIVARPKAPTVAPAPVVARPQAPSVVKSEPQLSRTGPCEVKPVMTDQDLVNCGVLRR